MFGSHETEISKLKEKDYLLSKSTYLLIFEKHEIISKKKPER